jgi:hypothetical protein
MVIVYIYTYTYTYTYTYSYIIYVYIVLLCVVFVCFVFILLEALMPVVCKPHGCCCLSWAQLCGSPRHTDACWGPPRNEATSAWVGFPSAFDAPWQAFAKRSKPGPVTQHVPGGHLYLQPPDHADAQPGRGPSAVENTSQNFKNTASALPIRSRDKHPHKRKP